jgi:ABC-2 type transport system ATP-binding protein
MSILLTQGLTKYYGSKKGVEKIDLEIKEGEVFGFIGPNGAGKSTTIRMIMQLIYPTSGKIYLFGEEVDGDRPDLRRKIGYLSSEVNLYKQLTGKQMLEFTARAYGLDLKDTAVYRYAEILQFDMEKKVKSYSLGNRKKLGILLCLLHRPKLLILDEPTSGLDPLMQHAFFQLLKELNEEGMTIFFSTHVLSEVEKLCDRVAIIRNGEIIQTAKVDEIPGRNKREVAVQFVERGDLIDKLGLKTIDPTVKYAHGVHYFTVEKEIHRFLAQISSYPIADMTIRQPSLEELFMHYYEKEGK